MYNGQQDIHMAVHEHSYGLGLLHKLLKLLWFSRFAACMHVTGVPANAMEADTSAGHVTSMLAVM